MRQSDFMAATPATPATAPTRSNAVAAGAVLPAAFSAGNASFNQTFRQVQADVTRFIAEGGSAAASHAGSALTADGAALRARLAASRALGGSEDGGVPDGAQQAFLDAIRPHAEAAAARLGVAPELVAAHAALESGWGRHAPGNNYFGVKAGQQWQGAVQALATVEVEEGQAVPRTAAFRGYADAAGAFHDYAGLLLNNARYRGALNTGGDAHAFAQALAAAGYATDPAYADKLSRVAARVRRAD